MVDSFQVFEVSAQCADVGAVWRYVRVGLAFEVLLCKILMGLIQLEKARTGPDAPPANLG